MLETAVWWAEALADEDKEELALKDRPMKYHEEVTS